MGANNSKQGNQNIPKNNVSMNNVNNKSKNILEYKETDYQEIFDKIIYLSNEVFDSYRLNFLNEEFCSKVALVYEKNIEKIDIDVLREIQNNMNNNDDNADLKLMLQHIPKNDNDKFFIKFFEEILNDYFFKQKIEYSKDIFESEFVRMPNKMKSNIDSGIQYIDSNHVKELLKIITNQKGGNNDPNSFRKKLEALTSNNELQKTNKTALKEINNMLQESNIENNNEENNNLNNNLIVNKEPNRNGFNKQNSNKSNENTTKGSNRINVNQQNNKGIKQQNNKGTNKNINKGPNQEFNKGSNKVPNQGSNKGSNQGSNKSPNQGSNKGQNKVPNTGPIQGSNKGQNKVLNTGSNKGPNKPSNKVTNQELAKSNSVEINGKKNKQNNKELNKNTPKSKYLIPHWYQKPIDFCEKSSNARCRMSKRNICKSISQSFVVRNNIVAAILTTIPRVKKIKTGNKISTVYEGGIAFQKFLNLEKCEVCVPRNFKQLMKEKDLAQVFLVLLEKSHHLDESSCGSNGGYFIKLIDDEQKILVQVSNQVNKNKTVLSENPKWEANHLYMEFMNRLKIKYFESLNYLIAILETLKNEPFISNSKLNKIARETKGIIDNLYNYVNYYYVYATLLLIKSETSLQTNPAVNQIKQIKAALKNNN